MIFASESAAALMALSTLGAFFPSALLIPFMAMRIGKILASGASPLIPPPAPVPAMVSAMLVP